MQTMSYDNRLRNFGFISFFLSGLCAMSSGIIVSLLQERYGFSFGTTGTLLAMMSVGSMAATFLSGIIPVRIGMRRTVLIFAAGYTIGYLMTLIAGWTGLLIAAFLMIGLAKGCALNNCSVMVGAHSSNRVRAMQILHACYAFGALLCPFVINALTGISADMPMIGIGACGVLIWLAFAAAGLPSEPQRSDKAQAAGDRSSFLRSAEFWLLTALVFCQNAAETSVTGWLVTYYKDSAILSGALSAYSMTVMWGATLIARLLIAFVIPIKNHYKAICIMGVSCTVLYAALVPLTTPAPAIAALIAFSAMMAGVNPMCTACVGKDISPQSMGVLLTIGSLGSALMPFIIGIVADGAGLSAGMLTNLVPCAGIAVLGFVLWRRSLARL